ncbi:ferrichrome-iron receptor [bacterium 336/3]|nr:ferrichrome-iron receptor [bacterium 336/3]
MKYILLPAFICMSSLVLAQSQTKDSTRQEAIEEISVNGSIIKTSKVSKNKLEEMDLPQAMSVLDNKILREQQIMNLTDVLKNVNGIYIMGNTGGYQEEIASRGSNISTTNTFKNGIRFFNGMKIEMSGIEKVEILKGNTAIEYGNVAPGGVLNIITKKPKFNFGGNASLTVGSFENYKPQIDVYGSLNKEKTIAFRLNASHQQAQSFRKYVNSNTFYVNPSLLFKISDNSTLLLEGDYIKSSTIPDFGAGIINYEVVDIPRERFLGVTWGKYNAEQGYASARYDWQISEKWHLNALMGFRNYATDLFSNTRPNASGGIIQTNGTWRRSIQRSTNNDTYFIQQIDANVSFKTGAIEHQALVGADAERFITNTTAYRTFSNYDEINIFQDYDPNAQPTIPNLDPSTATKNPINRYGVYAQDLISFPKYVKLFVGIRYNQIKSISDVFTYGVNTLTSTEKTDKPFSPKLGIILQPNKKHTVFASYSNSFSLNTGVDINGNALSPSIIDQYEVGIKNRLFSEKLQFNVTAYQIINSNLAQTSLINGNTNANIRELAGETKSKGIEVDAVFKPIKNLSVMFGYSFNETKYTQSNIYVIGSELRYNPKNTANASISYTFSQGTLKNLNVGVISQYFGSRFAGRSTRLTVDNDTFKLIPLSNYFLVDFVVGYEYKNWRLNGKLANIFNELNYNIHDDNSLNPITPANFSVQLGFTF